MKRIEIDQNIIGYQHDGKDSQSLGYNIYAFIHDKKALILDTAYSEHLGPVVKDLEKSGIEITAVLPSHYHPDHFEGLAILGAVDIYGSQASFETLKDFELTEDEHKTYAPNKKIEDGETLSFGEHRFKIEIVRGHSACSMFITINDKYLHVGDTYMTLNTGEHSLPYVTWSGVEDHKKALDHIFDFEAYSVMKSHGLLLESLEDMKSGLEDRIKYLSVLMATDNKASVEEALKETHHPFINQSWREYVK